MHARGFTAVPVLFLIAFSGCSSAPPAERLNAPPQGDADRASSLRESFAYMGDNALLHDMSVADIHFIPHSSELSGTGVVRLARLSPMLTEYGGIVRYETYEKDEKLVGERLAHVQEFLTEEGCDMSRVQVKTMISGGRGMRATDAIRIKNKGTSTETGGGDAGGAGSASASMQPGS